MGGIVGKVKGLFGEAFENREAAGIQQTPFQYESDTGFTGSLDAEGNVRSGMSPELMNLYRQGTGQAGAFMSQVPGAGQQATDLGAAQLSEVGSFDPYQAAEEQFGRLDAILEPGRQRQRTGTASGLLATGRLGGTAGNQVQAEVEGEIERQRQGLLSDQFASAQNVQNMMVNRGTQLGAFGMQQQMGMQQLGSGALQTAMALDAQRQANLGLGSQVSGAIGTVQPELAPAHQAGIGFLSNI